MLLKNIEQLKKQIIKSPQTPGVYAFYNNLDKVIYVGKAKKLKSRLKSYVDIQVLDKYPKTKKMVSQASMVKFFVVETELEALVLEANLIKQYQPYYNINLKDDKYYKFIKISKSKNGVYKLETSRKKTDKGSYFGPFPDGTAVNTVLKDIRRIFPYRNCSESKYATYSKLKRPCLYGNIGLCPAPCVGNLGIEQNHSNIQKIKKFLKGNSKKVIRDLKVEMDLYSKNLQYEKAVKIRDSIVNYEYLSSSYKSNEELMQGVGDLEKAGSNLHKLIKILSFYFPVFDSYLLKPESHLRKFKIEFYDISNLGNTYTVGSFITLEGEEYNKNLYRRFSIKNQGVQNDFDAMKQVLERRMRYLDKWGRPDLIVIDGGKGQLSSALKITQNFNIPTVSLAKKQETIFVQNTKILNKSSASKYITIDLPNSDNVLRIFIKGRDEVHRFVLSYNKSLRIKGIYKNN